MNLTINEIKQKVLTSKEYEFIHNSNNILLYLSGSYAYGTNVDSSDIDIRGIALNSKRQVLLGQDFGSVSDTDTDTVIYSFKKMINMLCSNSPSAIEIFGLNPEHIIYVTNIGKDLISKQDMFLTKKVGYAFKGYIKNSLMHLLPGNNLSNEKLSKYMVHPVRLYFTAADILTNHEVKIYRESEHDILMSIRNGEWLTKNGEISNQYYDLIEKQRNFLDKLIENCDLPDKVNWQEVEDYVITICEMIVNGDCYE